MDNSKKGQGFNDARGEIDDKEDVPKNDGLNVNNDPKRWQEKQNAKAKTPSKDQKK